MNSQMKWDRLPDVALLIVYNMLCNNDRLSMCLVCKNWSRLFQTPCLWKNCNIDIGANTINDSETMKEKSLLFAKTYGKYVKELKISWHYNSSLIQGFYHSVLSNLLLLFSSAKLSKFSLLHAELNCFFDNEYNQNGLVNTLCSFFRSQKSLKSIDMTSLKLTLSNGCKLLQNIGQASGQSMEELLIQDIFNQRLAVFPSVKYLQSMCLFPKLQYLATNYCCMSESIINKCLTDISKTLKYLSIKVHRDEPHTHKISQSVWNSFIQDCQGLKVSMEFENVEFSELISILEPELPLENLEFHCRYSLHLENDIISTLVYISETYSRTLAQISLILYNNLEIIDHALLYLLSKCKNLKKLKIRAIMLISTVDIICQMRTDGNINLASFHACVCGLRNDEWQYLLYVKENHEPMVKKLGLDFHFDTDIETV